MMVMSMSPEEQKQFWEMNSQVKSLFNVIIGDPLNKQPGFAERLNSIEEKQDAMDSKLKRLTYMFIGIGIGVMIGAAIFGYLSWKQVADVINKVK
jgi:tetrahydromethanopterin S-methyltransferase subunit G